MDFGERRPSIKAATNYFAKNSGTGIAFAHGERNQSLRKGVWQEGRKSGIR
jgi:hypothetical protein